MVLTEKSYSSVTLLQWNNPIHPSIFPAVLCYRTCGTRYTYSGWECSQRFGHSLLHRRNNFSAPCTSHTVSFVSPPDQRAVSGPPRTSQNLPHPFCSTVLQVISGHVPELWSQIIKIHFSAYKSKTSIHTHFTSSAG